MAWKLDEDINSETIMKDLIKLILCLVLVHLVAQ